MPDIFHYLVKLFVTLTLVYFFYHFVLRKLTFYTWNRWYLLLYSFISFIIPFIDIGFLVERNHWKDIDAIHYIPILEKYTIVTPSDQSQTPVFNLWSIVMIIMLSGIIIMLIRLGIQYLSVRKIRKSAILLHDEKLRLYHVDKNIMPFSFGNAIYVNRELHSEEDLKEIIRHEFVHVKQRHSVDILFSEFLCIINWYNPGAWLLRKAIRQNLEFIADHNVIQNGLDRRQYQFLLLKVIGVSNFSIANQFNYSSLKKRIAMMNKMKSARLNLFRFLFALPLAAILLLAFRKNQLDLSSPGILRLITDTLPVGTKSVSLHRNDKMDKEHKAFFDKNPSVSVLHWDIPSNTVEIYKNNEEVEKYDLLVNASEAENRYGKLPSPSMGSYSLIQATSADCINEKGYCIEIIGIKGHCSVVVKNKNKKNVEQVDLVKWNGNKHHYESLYGILPPPAPPRPVSVSISATAAPEIEAVSSTGVVSSLSASAINTIEAPLATTSVSVAAIAGTNIVQGMPVQSTRSSVAVIGENIPILAETGQPYVELPLELGPDDLQFEIYSTTSREELNQMTLKAKEKGATLVFSEIKYNEKNKLTSISGTFKNKDDQSNFVTSGFRKIILTMVHKDGHSHFYIMIKNREVS